MKENAKNLIDQVNYVIDDFVDGINEQKKDFSTSEKLTIDLASVEKLLSFVQTNTKKAVEELT